MFGLIGVAVGTIVPVAVFAVVVFARSCGVVGLSFWQGVRQIVWPTVWPAALVVGVLVATSDALPAGLVPVLGYLTCGVLAYAAIFSVCGLDRDERRWFVSTFTAIGSRCLPRLAAESALR